MENYNPYLPMWEYVPDGEPHVFGERVYVYGSHDKFGGTKYCMNDYVCWSADIHDLSQWKYEGVIYKKNQDPRMKEGNRELWAPDVVKGSDGRYYLYYCPDGDGNAIGVAVSEKPTGPYIFYGIVHDQGKTPIGKRKGDIWQFDPGVFIDDDGKIYLYSGNGPRTDEDIGKTPKGSCVMELQEDMLTIKSEPRKLLPILGEADGTDFAGHEFFEASSIRKIGKIYYLVYSSVKSRELCYAISEKPDCGYRYGGVIIDNSGIFNEKGQNCAQILFGNNHGGIEQINGIWYVFYHRHTNRTLFSRQGCVEPIRISETGKIQQAEITSQGFHKGPLKGEGTYPASMACILHGETEPGVSTAESKGQPYITQDTTDVAPEDVEKLCVKPQQYITELNEGSVIGYKYFYIQKLNIITVKVRGCADGIIYVRMCKEEKPLCQIVVKPSEQWMEFGVEVVCSEQTGSLLFTYHGAGAFDFLEFSLK